MITANVPAIGFASRSGWAALVALGRSQAGPQVLTRLRVEMFDHQAPESKQPYHAVEALGTVEAARRLDGYMAVAQGMAYSAINTLAENLAGRGYRMRSIGILDSSGKKENSLASALASHALLNTAEGEHFRKALTTAAERNGLNVSRIRKRDLEAVSADCLADRVSSPRRVSEHQLLTALRRAVRAVPRSL